MANQQARREQPKAFLDASLVPVQSALKHRAEMLEEQAVKQSLGPSKEGAVIPAIIADQFRQLAEELHYW